MRSILRSIVTACLIAAAVQTFTVGVVASNLPPVVGPPAVREERTMALPAAQLVRLENADGSVRVRTHTLPEIQVEATIRAYARSASDRLAAQAYVASLVRVNTEGDSLTILTEPDDRPDAVDLQVDYVLRVPKGTEVDVDSANGNVWVSRGCGRVTVEGRNTDIEVIEPGGPVAATSTNGRIRVVDAPAGATLHTVNGNIYAHMLGGVLRASTTNGVIVARVLETDVSGCDLTSQNGGITLLLEEGCDASIEAVTARGVITSTFTVDTASGVQKRRHLRGVIGKGTIKLNLDTLNGNIRIARNRV